MKTKLIALFVVAVITVSFTFIKKSGSKSTNHVNNIDNKSALTAVDKGQFNWLSVIYNQLPVRVTGSWLFFTALLLNAGNLRVNLIEPRRETNSNEKPEFFHFMPNLLGILSNPGLTIGNFLPGPDLFFTISNKHRPILGL